jgi:hypothetical protein
LDQGPRVPFFFFFGTYTSLEYSGQLKICEEIDIFGSTANIEQDEYEIKENKRRAKKVIINFSFCLVSLKESKIQIDQNIFSSRLIKFNI